MAENMVIKSKLKHRMGTLVIRTIPGAKVTVNQMAHEFSFGTAISRRIFTDQFSPENREKYLAVLKENFNSVVHENAMKWYSTEKKQGELTYHSADEMLKWCTDNGLQTRGHCVYWAKDEFVQSWIKDLDNQALRDALEARAINFTKHYRGQIIEFDVNNEMLQGDFYARRLGEPIRKEMFLWCQKVNPDAILYVNDYGILTGGALAQYEKQIESLLAQGAPIGGIGLQGHFGKSVSKDKVKGVLDSLSRFKLPIKITEFDMKTLDENAKAKGLENLYRSGFEHPSVDGILMWGFWAECHWLSSKKWGIDGYTALWDKDWNQMPAARVYRDLVFKEWWTNYSGTADKQGLCKVQVFLGRHKVTVPDAELIVELTKSESRKEVNLRAQPGAALDGAKTHRK